VAAARDRNFGAIACLGPRLTAEIGARMGGLVARMGIGWATVERLQHLGVLKPRVAAYQVATSRLTTCGMALSVR
jgi:hypothetical protein